MTITRTVQYEVVCDRCGQEYRGGLFYSLRDATAQAREAGWTVGSRVTCPDCRRSQ